jgi:hypothetical protein
LFTCLQSPALLDPVVFNRKSGDCDAIRSIPRRVRRNSAAVGGGAYLVDGRRDLGDCSTTYVQTHRRSIQFHRRTTFYRMSLRVETRISNIGGRKSSENFDGS